MLSLNRLENIVALEEIAPLATMRLKVNMQRRHKAYVCWKGLNCNNMSYSKADVHITVSSSYLTCQLILN